MQEAFAQLKSSIDELLATKRQIIIAIDGNCTAGKTTLADTLSRIYDCNVFHMDDFFLRQCQRTPERYAEPGGNVDYERFLEEVLLPLKSGRSFSYQPFDCQHFALGQPVGVTPKQLNIIEGTYSHHPYFGDIYDLRIVLTISPTLQQQRILQRPAFLHQRFFTEWIPMEEQYFTQHKIRDKADIVI